MVTHDFAEAHFLAQRVAVINNGRIEQAGPVADVFQRPATPFVAGFVGMKNIFPAVFSDGMARVGNISFRMAGCDRTGNYVAVRPEHVRLLKTRPASGTANVMRGTVCGISNQGVYSDIRVDAGALEFQCILNTSQILSLNLDRGSSVFLAIHPGAIHTF
jgi:molybdate/tungstate transport system ATP-binding protein